MSSTDNPEGFEHDSIVTVTESRVIAFAWRFSGMQLLCQSCLA